MASALPKPSSEQLNIIQCLDSNIIIDSVAGSGKTTTILHFSNKVKEINPNCRILLLTYNSKLRLETKKKVQELNLSQCLDVHTFHSFAYRYYQNDCCTDHQLLNILDKLHSETLPKFDYIIIDEIQDFTNIYYKLICMIIRDSQRKYPNFDNKFVIVGDVNQNIYEFKGATDKYLNNAEYVFGDLTSCKKWTKFKLSTSYRINNQMAEFINKVMLKNDRLLANKNGEKPDYVILDIWSDTLSVINQAIEKYGHENIFVIANSVKSVRTPVRLIARKISNSGIPIFIPNNDDERLNEKALVGKLVFSSMHQTKGLERKCIIVFGFDSFAFGDVEICSNILYVAATRATDKLILLHSNEKQFILCLELKLLTKYCNFYEKRKIVVQKTSPPTNSTEMSKLTDYISPETINNILKLIKYDKILQKNNTFKLTNIVEFKYKDKTLIETVSEINGIAATTWFEYIVKKGEELSIRNDMRDNTMKYKNINENINKKIKNDDSYKILIKTLTPLDNQCYDNIYQFSTNDITQLSSVYVSYRSETVHKLNHLPKCTWISCDEYKKIYDVLSSQISNNCLFEVILHIKNYEYNNKKQSFYGRVDIFDLATNTLWEIKTVSEIKPEHIIQTAVYAYFFEISIKAIRNDDIEGKYKSNYMIGDKLNEKLLEIESNLRTNPQPLKYKLFNILSGEITEIDINLSQMSEVIKLLLNNNYTTYDNFTVNVNETKNVYLNSEMNTVCVIKNDNSEENLNSSMSLMLDEDDMF